MPYLRGGGRLKKGQERDGFRQKNRTDLRDKTS